MTKNIASDPLKILESLTLKFPSFFFHFALETFSFKSKTHKAEHIFRKQLIEQGLNRSNAAQLTSFYLEGSDPFKMLRLLV